MNDLTIAWIGGRFDGMVEPLVDDSGYEPGHGCWPVHSRRERPGVSLRVMRRVGWLATGDPLLDRAALLVRVPSCGR